MSLRYEPASEPLHTVEQRILQVSHPGEEREGKGEGEGEGDRKTEKRETPSGISKPKTQTRITTMQVAENKKEMNAIVMQDGAADGPELGGPKGTCPTSSLVFFMTLKPSVE